MFNGEKIVSSINGLERDLIFTKNNKIYYTIIINLKWVKDKNYDLKP